jgi:hypothetical protein
MLTTLASTLDALQVYFDRWIDGIDSGAKGAGYVW